MPMSPKHPEAPARAGSVFQAKRRCCSGVRWRRSVPCSYHTRTAWTSPNSPARTISRAWRTRG
jgi:hypothetical protein